MTTVESPHRAVRMGGRDPHESGRASTPLELLFDLTFVIAFGAASDELAHLVSDGHVAAGILGFCFATFAVSWAWINFTWFASAYDTDDWVFRLTTMVQMVGVLVLALGLPQLFASLAAGRDVDNKVMVLGYVVMRVPMVAQWLRAAAQDPSRSGAARVMVATLVLAQAAWVGLSFLPLHVAPMLALAAVLILVEVSGPVFAERRRSETPWHAHHIVERYGLMVIIALGEGLLGTTAALGALVERGWSVDVVVLGLGGVALVFGIWWTYFVIPSAPLLHAHRERGFGWGYGHIPLFGAVVAVGSGLHTCALFLQHSSDLGALGALLAVAVPLAAYLACLYALYAGLAHSFDPWHLPMLGASALVLAVAVGLAAAGADLVWCVLVLASTPWITVVGYELVGHRHGDLVAARAGT